MNRDELLSAIDVPGALDLLGRMIQHQSYSGTPGEAALARFMVDQMAAMGLEAELLPVEGERCNAVGRRRGKGGGKSLVFNGHIDTNPVTAGWTVDPLAGHRDRDFIYGIGVSNMKAGDAAYFWALKTLIDHGVELAGDVILTFVVGELQGGLGTHRMLTDGLRGDFFINAEPTDLAALTLHAGSFNFVIELQGITRHMSKREEAIDAIAVAAELIPEINAMTFSGAASEAHRSINRANVGIIRGALTPEFQDWRPPQIADFVRLSGACRYAPSQSVASCLADIGEKLKVLEGRYPGLTTSVARLGGDDRPMLKPFEVDPGSRIVQSVNAAYRTVRQAEQPTGAIRPPCFYGTDAAHFLHIAQMPGIVCGPGGRYNTMPDERVDIPDFVDAIRIYMLAMLDICGVA